MLYAMPTIIAVLDGRFLPAHSLDIWINPDSEPIYEAGSTTPASTIKTREDMTGTFQTIRPPQPMSRPHSLYIYTEDELLYIEQPMVRVVADGELYSVEFRAPSYEKKSR